MLKKETILDLIRHFIVFEKSKKEDAKTGLTTISTVKKMAAYHQYYAVNRAVESTLRATGYLSNQSAVLDDTKEKAEEHPEESGLPDEIGRESCRAICNR